MYLERHFCVIYIMDNRSHQVYVAGAECNTKVKPQGAAVLNLLYQTMLLTQI